ncbi:MAG TPA: L-threonylcarbamoyladenylate synthase [Cytophagales bacterium]|nr:L-threonylcarbamoyladenylate synthase [Cytophagales bacterium]
MFAEIGTNISLAREILENGDLVSIPTETVYGLAGNAFNPDAVIKIFKVKNRPSFDPLIVHTYSIDKVQEFVEEIPDKAKILMKKFWPGPLTVLLKKKQIIPDLVTSGSHLVAVRIPGHSLTLKLLSSLSFPLAAPSANPFGYISPTTAQHVYDQLGDKLKYILDGGSSLVGIESTIVGFEEEETIVYRLGGISIESLEKEVGKIKTILSSSSKPSSPGMLSSHYAPSKEVVTDLSEALKSHDINEVSYLAFKEYNAAVPVANQFLLSKTGSVEEAASNLFAGMRKLDGLPTKIIVVEFLPEKGLGRAINDRLRRASVK